LAEHTAAFANVRGTMARHMITADKIVVIDQNVKQVAHRHWRVQSEYQQGIILVYLRLRVDATLLAYKAGKRQRCQNEKLFDVFLKHGLSDG
jgi:hypothetical protein